MVAEEIVVSLSGGAPWGFRLQGGADQQKPLQVAKVRRRSKACRAGLKERDELVAIGDQACGELSHAQAMGLIDAESATLVLRVNRAPGFYSSSTKAPPPAVSSIFSPTGIARDITSPPDSEAYYGETDSDADTRADAHRRQRRTPPHARSPARYDNQEEEEETSEMSGYESATDAGLPCQGQWDAQGLVGVPRRELLYQPLQAEWATPAHTPHTLTPHTLTPTPDQVEAEGEGDSGFQEAGACPALACPPLVSPERAREALARGSSLVPMVGPQQTPVSDELSATYMDKARQAKLQRGESIVEKQVKEARSKCRSIASLLTDAPNPNSKGVLMFKKRRQRAKKYTLTCFGKAEGDGGGEAEGETGGETEEEGGSAFLSGSEVDEEGFFSPSFDPTWDSGYLDLLDRRSSACPTPKANQSPGLDVSTYQTPPVNHIPGPENSAYQGSVADNRSPMSPPAVALGSGRCVAVSRASVVLSPPSQTGLPGQNGQRGNSHPGPDPNSGPNPSSNPDPPLNASLSPNSNVLNRTARPFTPAPSPARATVTSVMFRPPHPRPAAATQPVAAVSMATVAPSHHPDARRAVSSASLYIPPRSTSGGSPPSVNAPSAALSPPSSLPPPPFTPLPSAPFSPPAALAPSLSHPFSPQPPPSTPTHPPTSLYNPAPPTSPPCSYNMNQVSIHWQPTPHPPAAAQSAPPPTVNAAMATAAAADPPVAREQRISVPAARTGILHDARRRSNKKPMFSSVQKQDVSPNPDLLSMVQNLDDRGGRAAGAGAGVAPNAEAGHESGPEEDWLRLGAEACNFMQAQRGPRPPPVAPKPQAPQAPQLGGKGGQLFARRQNRMDRYVVDRSPSVAAAPYSPAQTREPSPTPSLPAAWKYSPNIRAPPPISYNPLLSPSCPPKAQKKPEVTKSGSAGPKGKKAGVKPVDITNHKPHQLNSTLFSYGGGAPQDPPSYQRGAAGGPQRTARVYEVKRFSTPPPVSTGPSLKVIAPRSATTLGEPLWRSAVASPPPHPPFQHQTNPSQWATLQPSHPPPPPPPTAPLPRLPSFSSAPIPAQTPTSPHHPPSTPPHASRQFKSAPDLSPLDPAAAPRLAPGCSQTPRVPRPRFSTSNLGLQPCVWHPGSTTH